MPAFGAGCQQRCPTKPQTDSDRVTFEVFPRGVNCWETLEVDGKENTSLVGDLTNPFGKIGVKIKKDIETTTYRCDMSLSDMKSW